MDVGASDLPFDSLFLKHLPLDSRDAFINKITQHTVSLLPVPAASNTKRKRPSSSLPRRSRQLAGADAEFDLHALESKRRRK